MIGADKQAAAPSHRSFLGSLADTCELLDLATIERYRKGEYIFYAGDPADCIYVLLRGSVKKLFVNLSGDEKTISLYFPGDIFGHLFLGKYRHRISSACALEDVEAARLSETSLTALVQQLPQVGLKLIAYLADEQRETLARLHALMHLDARTRLMGTLLSLGRRLCCHEADWFQLPATITQENLASLACMNRSTVNIYLSELRAQGIVGGRGRVLTVSLLALERQLHEAGLEILE
ncbi:MAG: Crp/Fnr family transcriptional regulator [Chloroflexi bacterium]|nr:Crp/Fnr family transcriptional regulator [Chloroflexota bacterium]